MVELLLDGKRSSLPDAYDQARDTASILGLESIGGIDTSTS